MIQGNSRSRAILRAGKESEDGDGPTERGALTVKRRPFELIGDDKRVITRLFGLPPWRIKAVLDRIADLSDAEVSALLDRILTDFCFRHTDIESAFLTHYRAVARYCGPNEELSHERKLLIGSYFTMEYSIESAALFNPSMVLHPDQGGIPAGWTRFLMSLRATGEGHVSSIVFRAGVIEPSGEIHIDPSPRQAVTAKPVPDRLFENKLFYRKLMEMGVYEELVVQVLDLLPDHFTMDQLNEAIHRVRQRPGMPQAIDTVAAEMEWLAHANYELRFPQHCDPAEMVIFPGTDNESHGMEDLRLVRFVEDTGEPHYYGTYTAYDGSTTVPMMLDTADFKRFSVHTLNGRHAKNKGMALFPRRIGGDYMMIARVDGENLFLLRSDLVHFWNEGEKLEGPHEPWEFLQIGNCGSPIETPAGWILLTHGVGPVREYCIGAMLLDLEDPTRIIGRLREPLLVPYAEAREGYVPNVVYSCGSMIHQDELIIPYAMSDSRTTIASVSVSELLDRLARNGP